MHRAGVVGFGGHLALLGLGRGQLGLELLDLVLGLDVLRPQQVDLVLKRTRIEFKQQIALVNLIAFGHVDARDLAAHLRRNLHDIGLHVGVGGERGVAIGRR